ncbi:Parvovirus coat protein VP1-like protein [Fredinandcohnia sp. 179-A 10B2 NHS]
MYKRRRVGFCMPGYRWCGPGCGGSGPPTNAVDNCCMQHDFCYQRFGPSRICDEAFLHCLETKSNPFTKEGRDANFFSKMIKLKSIFTPF